MDQPNTHKGDTMDLISVKDLGDMFPPDEYGRPGLIYVQSDYGQKLWLDFAGLCDEEREQFSGVFVACLPGECAEDRVVGIFGCRSVACGREETLDTIWWWGELKEHWSDANEYWRDEREREHRLEKAVEGCLM